EASTAKKYGGGGRRLLAMYFATVVCTTLMPSLSSSPCIRGAPQSGFAMLILRVKRRMSTGTEGRPPSGWDFQRPFAPDPGPVPAQQGRGPYNLESVQRPRSHAIESHKQQPIYAAESGPLRATAPQNVQLMPKHENFGFQRSARSEQPYQGMPRISPLRG